MKKMSPNTILAVVTAVILLLGGSVVLAGKTSNDGFCVSCHAYEKVSWDHGDHPYVGCVSCHTKGALTDKTKGLRKLYLAMSSRVNPHNDKLPSYKEAIADNCIGCHMREENLAALPYYKERHDEYRKHAVDCLACHEPGHVLQLKSKRTVASRLPAN
jgi:cytochrome c nitrite reductase small subunit